MNPKISKLKAEKEKNLKKIADMNARIEEIDKLITELENLDIIGLVRECRNLFCCQPFCLLLFYNALFEDYVSVNCALSRNDDCVSLLQLCS